MRSQTQILHSLRSRIAVLGARSAPSRYSQPAKGEAPQPKGYARRLSSMWPLLAALAIYFVLRLQSGAFWPATAPSYYRLTIQPSILFRNALEYLDRGATWPVAVALLVAIAARTRPILAPGERRILALGALWFAFGYAITVSVPVRSSLYAVFPSIGACIAAAAVVAALIRQQPSRALRALAVASVIPSAARSGVPGAERAPGSACRSLSDGVARRRTGGDSVSRRCSSRPDRRSRCPVHPGHSLRRAATRCTRPDARRSVSRAKYWQPATCRMPGATGRSFWGFTTAGSNPAAERSGAYRGVSATKNDKKTTKK